MKRPPSQINYVMLTSRLILATCFCVLLTEFGAANAEAQGIFRRLRDRISNAARPQLDNSANQNRLPARPLEPATRSEPGAVPNSSDLGTNPAAQYQRPGNPSSAAAGLTPTPAISGQGTQQAAASQETLRRGSSPPGPFGQSILSPSGPLDPGTRRNNASIGIKAVAANPGYPAVEVTQILGHSLAKEAGLRVGDYIFAIDGVPTPTVAALVGEVAARNAGEAVRLRIGRGGRVSDLDVTLSALPDVGPEPSQIAPQMAFPGSALSPPFNRPADNLAPSTQPTDSPLAKPALSAEALEQSLGIRVVDQPGMRGVVVQEVRKASVAARAGIQQGDRIVAFNGKLVSDVASLGRWVATATASQPADLRVTRQNRLVDVVLPAASNDANEKPGTDEKPGPAGSLTNGLGAVFGGLFNASSSSASATESTLPAPTEAEPVDVLALEKPMELPKRTATGDSETEDAAQPANAEIRAEMERLRAKLEALESQLEGESGS